MLCAFVHGKTDVVLVLGLTPDDIRLAVRGVPFPAVDLETLADHFDCPLPGTLQIVFGNSEEEIEARIHAASTRAEGEDDRVEVLPAEQMEQYMKESQVSPAHMAAHAAEEQAIKRAQSKLNNKES
jgi:hypothetical protein